MSQITRCPSCGTMFKVVADQLKVSKGWVRCGHCAEVFDGRLHLLQDQVLDSPAIAIAISETDAEPDSPESRSEVFVAPVDAPLQQTAPDSPVAPIAPAAIAATQSLPPDSAKSHPSDAGLSVQVFLEPAVDETSTPSDEVAAHQTPSKKDAPESNTRPSRPNFHPSGPSRAEVRDLAFMRESRSRLFWSSPLVRGALALTVLLLMFGLGLQVALDQRDRLAALEPSSKPWLQKLCEPFRCEVLPLRQLEFLVIEGSSFHRLAPQTYRLSFSLRNIGELDVASPALDLVLTDAQDQTLARRVLSAAETSMPAIVQAGSEWTGTQVLRVSPTLGDIAGYRILAFYP